MGRFARYDGFPMAVEAAPVSLRSRSGHGNAHRADAASARSARTARRLAVDSERAVAGVVAEADRHPGEDLAVRAHRVAADRREPGVLSVVWPCTPDQTASPAVVTSSTSIGPR